MRKRSLIPALFLALTPFINGCKDKAGENSSDASKEASKADVELKRIEQDKLVIEKLNHDYPRVPVEGKILEKGENPCFNELKQRYHDHMAKLKQEVEATGAKFAVVLLSLDGGGTSPASIAAEKYTIPYIKSTCSQLGVDFYDFSTTIRSHGIKEMTQLPKDGHLSKIGASVIADEFAAIIKKYPAIASKVTYKDNERPESFGDLPPNDDEVLDGGKDMPYHVKANTQGVRMDHDLTFPKKKKRILLMGDSGLFCPFLDNEFTVSYVLQQKLPDYEVYSVAAVNWTFEDYLSLWNDKTKFTEPDMVIVSTNASDIEDYFFTNRNHCSRSGKPFAPTPVEEKYYKETYK